MKTRVKDFFPCVRGFGDYHEIEECASILSDFISPVRSREIAFNGRYWGVFWLKTEGKPDKKTIQNLLDKAGVKLNRGELR